MAGNTAVTTLDEVMITNNWLKYILNTPAILYPLIAGTILGVGLIAILVGRTVGKRQRNSKAA